MSACGRCGAEAELVPVIVCYAGVDRHGKFTVLRQAEVAACPGCRSELSRGEPLEKGISQEKEAA